MIELLGMSSPNVIKVVLMLEELGLEYQLRHINVFAGEQFEPAFKAISPNSKVPVLIDHDAGGQAVFESGAMLLYLARKSGRFMPEDPVARTVAEQWLMFQTASVGPMFGQYVHYFSYAPKYAPDETYGIRRYGSEAARLCGVLESRAAESAWLAGDEYGLADMAVWPWLRIADTMFPIFLQQGMWDRLPSLRRWFDAVGARPAAKAAIESIGKIGPNDMRAFQSADADGFDRFLGRGKYDHTAP